MKITARIDRPIVGPAGGRRYPWVRLEAPRRAVQSARQPLDIALVLDRSGSMSGAKINLARQAAKGAAQLLRETDRCALVAYDNDVLTPVPAGAVDSDQRSRLSLALDSIDARGSTDLFGGWAAGAEQVSADVPGRIRRVLLLTDGLANVGIVDPDIIQGHVRELNLRGVGTSTFGVGADFDEVLVGRMAEAGGGHFYYVERPEQIPDYLASELGELLTVVARSVQLSVQVTGKATIQCLNDLPIVSGMHQLGDLSEAAIVDLLFSLDIATGNQRPITVQVDVSWVEADSQAERGAAAESGLALGTDEDADAAEPDGEAVRQVVLVRGARVREQALMHNRKGEYREAKRMVDAELAEIRSISAAAPAARSAVDDLMDLERLGEEMTMAERKRAHTTSYQVRRSRYEK